MSPFLTSAPSAASQVIFKLLRICGKMGWFLMARSLPSSVTVTRSSPRLTAKYRTADVPASLLPELDQLLTFGAQSLDVPSTPPSSATPIAILIHFRFMFDLPTRFYR